MGRAVTPTLLTWADQWGVSAAALADLQRRIGVATPPQGSREPTGGEAWATQQVRLEAAEKRIQLWRNNSGAVTDAETGRLIRYGLCNDSKQLNARFKSADLVGLKPDGQFVAREIKAPGWRFTGTEREMAQLAWIELVNAWGGDAAFATGRGTL